MRWLILSIVLTMLQADTFAETAGQAEVRQELERIFAPTPGPRPHPSQVITGLIRKYGRENVADMAIQPLTAALKGKGDYFMQEQIAWALFELKDPRSVPALVEFLHVEKFGDWGAEKTLIAIGEPSVVPLVEAVRAGKTNQQFLQKAAKALGELKDVRAVPVLVDGLASTDWSLPRVCAEALASIGGTDAVDALIAALKSTNRVAKFSATRAVGAMKNSRTVPALIELLKDKERNLRGEAAKALGEIGDPAAIEPLVEALADVQGEASNALSKLRASGAAPVILRRFRESGNPKDRQMFLRALTHMGDPAIDTMIAALDDVDAETRYIALQSLHAMSTPQYVVAQAVSKENQQRGREAILPFYAAGKADDIRFAERVNIIASIEDPRAVQLTLRTLKNKEEGYEDCPWYVPQDIYIAFEKAKAYVVDPVIEAMADPDPSIRAGAAAVLGHIPLRNYGAQPEVDAIRDRIAKVLTKAMSDAKEHEAVREKAGIALGYVGDSRHTAALVAVLKDKTAPLIVRGGAAHGFVLKAERSLAADFLQIFRDKTDDQHVRVAVARILQGMEHKYNDATIRTAFAAVKMDRSDAAAVRAAARTNKELIDRLKANTGVVKARGNATQIPHGKQAWPGGIIKEIISNGERTMIRIESQGTRQSAKSWYDKEFADWKIYKDWNQLPIMAMPGDGEWKVWIRQNVCCLVSLHDDRGGRTGVFQAFDQEEDLQEFLAAIPQEQAKRETCSRNLQAIQSAKGSAQRNLKLDPEAASDATQLARFIPGGFEKLVCPNGGKYDIGTLRKPARCSIHGTQAAIGRRR